MDIACPTCLNPFTLECDISATKCGHVFHTNCIEKWLKTGKKTCPQCRKNCIVMKLYLNWSATENGKKRNAIQAKLDHATSEVKRLKSELSEMEKKDEINKSMCKWLFKNNPSSQGGSTLLHWSATLGHLYIYQSVMEKAVDKNPKDKEGTTPLHCAADNGHLDICQLILKNTEEKCPKDEVGWTPLHCSAEKGHTLIHKMIMTVSSDKNPEDTGGYTPLHSAAENGHVELCRLIMDEIKDIFPKTEDKITPLHLATRGGHTAVKDLIIEYVEKN
jgi:ankyrin repeat protein